MAKAREIADTQIGFPGKIRNARLTWSEKEVARTMLGPLISDNAASKRLIQTKLTGCQERVDIRIVKL
jgi:hypothetical protein